MKQKSYLIGIDEYQRDQFFMLGAAIATDAQAKAIDRKWTRLQEKIKERLLTDKPDLVSHPKLVGDQLPEIHAVELIQSTGYYRIKNPTNPRYWERQYEWLESALSILRHYGVSFLFYPLPDYSQALERKGAELVAAFEEDAGIALDDTHRTEVIRRTDHPYIRSFSTMIGGIDWLLEHRQARARVVCDEYNDCREFSELDCYEILRNSGQFSRMDTPKFLSSTDETIIQAADVACYVLGKLAYELNEENKSKGHKRHHTFHTFEVWYRKYINPTDLKATKYGVPGQPVGTNMAISRLMLAEMILLRSGGSALARTHLADAFQMILDASFPK